MQKEIDAVNTKILTKITPTQEDRAKIEALAKQLEQQVASACEAHGVKAKVRVEGSVAKDTWLREEPDIDIFMRLPTSIPRKSLGEISLKIAREATPNARQIERFAEHPYLEAFIDSVRVNIVPCYDAKPGEWLSATDRTPFHTDYVKKRLNERLRGEVRLLKKFLQGIKAYGAEIKTGGFSGYLCELLVLRYESFTQTLQAFTQFTPRTTIDIERYYKGRERELRLFFPEPLVIVDPVDKGRNVASAVQPQKLYTLVAAARVYLKKPATLFFYPPKTEALTTKALKTQLENHGSDLIFLPLGKIDAVPDVLWGQLYKTQRALRKQIELSDFKVLRDAAWSDEKNLNAFVFEVEQRRLPSVKKHLGPPLERENECENFLSKYSSSEDVVSGPYIEDGRWIVELKRKYTDIAALLKEKLTDGGRNAGVAELIAQAFRKKLEVLVNTEVIEIYRGNRTFAEFLTAFLSGKPFWMANTVT
ncbi:CCA tRNA nucleotidyltransferase [Candidatus Bathyarchaeota archaeon A05DMB-2]|jgi:tRNA nucleotidyltransferase (CCA-adding enzyme)|nr:CCA tRNA nucleotidyltransferase [Candidatus Bathyarchaeota archaeon A05DMB-2]